jgi:hypothetical protein
VPVPDAATPAAAAPAYGAVPMAAGASSPDGTTPPGAGPASSEASGTGKLATEAPVGWRSGSCHDWRGSSRASGRRQRSSGAGQDVGACLGRAGGWLDYRVPVGGRDCATAVHPYGKQVLPRGFHLIPRRGTYRSGICLFSATGHRSGGLFNPATGHWSPSPDRLRHRTDCVALSRVRYSI